MTQTAKFNLLRIEEVPLDSLKPYGNNPRKNDHGVKDMATAISTFGFRVPILVKADGLIIDGHLRYKASQQLKLTTVPVIVCDDLTEAQIKALRLSSNRMAEIAEWDTELLEVELLALTDMDIDIRITGFSYNEINQLIGDLGELTDAAPQNNNQETDADDLVACPKCATRFKP